MTPILRGLHLKYPSPIKACKLQSKTSQTARRWNSSLVPAVLLNIANENACNPGLHAACVDVKTSKVNSNIMTAHRVKALK